MLSWGWESAPGLTLRTPLPSHRRRLVGSAQQGRARASHGCTGHLLPGKHPPSVLHLWSPSRKALLSGRVALLLAWAVPAEDLRLT